MKRLTEAEITQWVACKRALIHEWHVLQAKAVERQDKKLIDLIRHTKQVMQIEIEILQTSM